MAAIRMTNAALHESPLRGGTITLRGVIHVDSLNLLKYDHYQREAPSLAKQKDLVQALQKGEALPDIEIGMRGHRVRDIGEGSWYLNDDCFVIDGQRRVLSCIQAHTIDRNLPIFLGAVVHFGTDYNWERDRFHKLNGSNRIKISPNVLLRNMRDDHRSIGIIYNMSHNLSSGTFALADRVSWDQNMAKGKLLTALNVLRSVQRLHGHLSAYSAHNIEELARQLDAIVDITTPSAFRDNTRHFFELVDDVWGIRNIHYRDLAKYLSLSFLETLAKILSNHEVFWRPGNKLLVEAMWRRKLKTFPISDPNILPLATAAGAARQLLYMSLLDHLNSGKRTKRLKPRHAFEREDVEGEVEEVQEAA